MSGGEHSGGGPAAVLDPKNQRKIFQLQNAMKIIKVKF